MRWAAVPSPPFPKRDLFGYLFGYLHSRYACLYRIETHVRFLPPQLYL